MDIRRALLVLRRWWPLLIVGTLIAAGAAYAVSKSLPKVYDATTIMQVNPGIGTVGGGLDFNEVQASWSEANKVAQLIVTTDIAQTAIDKLNHTHTLQKPIDAGTLLKNTKATAGSQLGTVTLDVRASTPQDASNLANAMTSIFMARDAQWRVAGFKTSLTKIEQQIQSYNQDYRSSQLEINRLSQLRTLTPSQQARSNVLFQRISTDPSIIASLQQSMSGIELRLAGAGNTLSLVQSATPPTTWVSPRTSINVAVAAILALLVLLGVVFLIDFFDDRPRRPLDVAISLDAPLLASIDAAPKGTSPLAMLEQPASSLADAYRALRVALAETLHGADGAPVLAVTGMQPGDGASTVAVNLAAAVARSGLDVILVDANPRRPALHAIFGLSEPAGLAEALFDDVDPVALLRETRLPHLRVLTAGRAPAEALDLLGSPRMSAVLSALRASGHLVVLDTAPSAHAEAALTAALAGATVLVARLRATNGAALAYTSVRLRRGGARLAGTVVTLFSPPAPAVQAAPAVDASTAAEPRGRTGLRSAK